MNYQTARKCATLSQEVYEDLATLKFSEWPGVKPYTINNPQTDTQLAILEDPARSLAVIVFRGSSAAKDWQFNLKVGRRRVEIPANEKKALKRNVKQMTGSVSGPRDLVYPAIYGRSRRNVKMHQGFMEAYLSVRAKIQTYLQNSTATNIRVTGHSLGGALATLCAVDVQYNFGDRINHLEVYTFGAPKAGNKSFVDSYNERVPHTWRIVYGRDMVASLPRWWQGYQHVDSHLALKRRFDWRFIRARVTDHRMSNYIRALDALANQENVASPMGKFAAT